MSELSASRSNIIIRPAVISDIKAILEIQNKSAVAAWTINDYSSAVADDSQILLIAETSNKIIGFALMRLITAGVEILNIAVLPEFRKQKVGQCLFDEIIAEAKRRGAEECWLEVRESNLAARRFYEANDFQIVGRRKNYYDRPTEDAVLMTLIFSDGNPKK